MTPKTESIPAEDNELLPIANFTDAPQAVALVERFGDRDLAQLSEIDQAALVLILAKLVYLHACSSFCDIWQAADLAISSNQDSTSDDMEAVLEILEGIDADTAIALIQFLVQ